MSVDVELPNRWVERGWLRPVDAALAGLLRQEVPDADPRLLLAAALVSHLAGRGETHMDLAVVTRDPALTLGIPPPGAADPDPGDGDLPAARLAGLDAASWRESMRNSLLVAEMPGQEASRAPLVLVGTRLYLRRYWQCEQEVRAGIAARLTRPGEWEASPGEVLDALQEIWPDSGRPGVDWQKVACALMARSRFGVITGGPGTGKTTTVARLLALLQTLSLAQDGRPLRIRLAAPTGKAAARLGESIADAIGKLTWRDPALRERALAAIPRKVTTLHRLMGRRRDSRHFRHDADHPLWIDVLVIDEASMVGLELLAAVLLALPVDARLVLLGDKDQLAAVEAGSPLGELCRRAAGGHYTPAIGEWLSRACGQELDESWIDPEGRLPDQAVVMLRDTYRFAAGSGIGRLAMAVNGGDTAAMETLWGEGCPELSWVSLAAGEGILRDLTVDGEDGRGRRRGGYRVYLETMARQRPAGDADRAALDRWGAMVLRAHAGFQVLCAIRQGPWGVEGLNRRIARHLRAAGLIPAEEGWYAGRPVMVTSNDYDLGLMNGDIGVTLEVPVAGGWVTRVVFPGPDGVRWFAPARLAEVETVYALTVHKSQGSEFAQVVLVLPDRFHPVLTRELIYTGITRARDGFSLASASDARLLEQAVTRRVVGQRVDAWL
ncbi:MAG: exodeoxyribonuclease V subunit alpha [Magnetococcales bacterium]|nr:exodeoxyribonuclease V subunit alpha [Magnetococcales bacterium]